MTRVCELTLNLLRDLHISTACTMFSNSISEIIDRYLPRTGVSPAIHHTKFNDSV